MYVILVLTLAHLTSAPASSPSGSPFAQNREGTHTQTRCCKRRQNVLLTSNMFSTHPNPHLSALEEEEEEDSLTVRHFVDLYHDLDNFPGLLECLITD